MSKKVKNKLTGMDYTYRIVNALMAISVPFVAYFANMIYYIVESPLFATIAQIQGNTDDDGSTYGYLGFHMFVKEYLPMINESTENKDSLQHLFTAIEPIKPALIATGVFLALAIVIALAIVVVSIASNSRKIQLALSSAGLLSLVGMFIAFKYVSTPLTDGTIGLGNFFDSILMSLILPYIASFSLIHLSTAWVIMLVLYIGMFLWSGSNLLIDLGDAPKKAK